MSENHKIKKIFEFDKVDFWLVSGDRVHSMFDPNWKNDIGEGEFIGGHHYVFRYIPESQLPLPKGSGLQPGSIDSKGES